MDYFRILIAFCLIFQVLSVPVPQASEDFCTGEKVLNFENGKDYTYEYETDTMLFINDISDEAKSNLKLKTNVVIGNTGDCTYQLKLEGTSVTGESMNIDASSLKKLNDYNAVFRLNSLGELDSNIKFDSADEQWSKNIKRAIISAFQIKSYNELREAENTDTKSAVVYESDVLGRCRTTYKVKAEDYQSQGSFSLEKKKALQRCTRSTSQDSRAIGLQFVPYKQIPEFFDGRLFIEDYKCQTVVKDNIINNVECQEVSTFKIGSRGVYGVQAIVNQKLSLKSVSDANAKQNPKLFQTESINFEYYDSKTANIEAENFSAEKFTTDICENVLTLGLTNEHSSNFKDLVLSLQDNSASELISFYESSQAKCRLAGLTAAQALVFTNTDESVEACLSLIDNGDFDNQKYITEYPVLTALARNSKPSENLINKLKEYLESKPVEFEYLNKLSLVYSTLVYTYCKNADCSKNQLNNYSSVFSRVLGDDCSDEANKGSVVAALKSIGNIGQFENTHVLEKCASNKANEIETRVNAINALRRFNCEDIENLKENYNILQDTDEDSELRINAFLSIMKCSDNSENFAQFASNNLADFLVKEEDSQVLSFIIDYGKEHGITSVLNAALNDPKVRSKFASDFKTLSWNNYRYKYNVMRDGAVEVDTSVIYTPQTWIPRSINYNITIHMFGASFNFLDANLRLEGLDEILKAVIIDKLTSEKLLKRIMENPEQLIDILQIVADKLKYTKENPKLTLSMRVYGSDVFYSRLDNKENFQKLANFVKNPRETVLYRQVETIKNMFFIDTQFTQPLMNGLSFSRRLDISSALLMSKKSVKENENNELSFHVDNFWSGSFALSARFEVNVNTQNKLSLKKRTMLNSRCKLNVEGYKKSGDWQYNMHLSPMKSIPLFVARSNYFKLSNSGYNEVKEFKTKQKKYTVCNSDKFKATFGLELCLSVDRPDFGSIITIAKQRRQGDLEELFNEYYKDLESGSDGDDNENDNTKRPMLVLAGPYNYEFTLNNPNLIKTVVLDAKFNRNYPVKTDFTLGVSTVSQQDEKVKHVELVYSRTRDMSYLGYHGIINIELRQVETNDVRLKFLAEINYQKNQVFTYHLEVENKILRPFHHKLSFGRDKRNVDNIIPKYHLEILIDSQARGPKRYNLAFDITPENRDISSNFILEVNNARTNNQNFKVAEGKLTLTSNSDSEHDYTVKLNAENNLRNAKLDVDGNVFLSIFKSDINLSVDYKNPRITLPKPIKIKLGHLYDGSKDAVSYFRVHVEHALRGIDHGMKTSFIVDVMAKKLSLLQVDIDLPYRSQPVTLFYKKNANDDGKVNSKEYEIGLRNGEIWLSPSTKIGSTLIKVDDQTLLKSLVFAYSRVHVRGEKIDYKISAKKNEKQFVTVNMNAFGNIAVIKSSSSELPSVSFGGDFYVKVFDNSGAVSTKLDLESSPKNNKHNLNFVFKTDNLFKILTKLVSIESKFELDGTELDAQFEIKRLGEVKGFKLISTSILRRNGDFSEFDLHYEKYLASGTVLKGSGIGRFLFKNFKNFETSVTVNGHYISRMLLENKREDYQNGLFAYHNFEFGNSHLDFEPAERKVHFLIHNRTEQSTGFRNMDFILSSKQGELNNLENKDALTYIMDVSSKNTLRENKLVRTLNSLTTKSKRFNLDLYHTINFDASKIGAFKANTKTDLKVPGIFSGAGKLVSLAHEANLSKSPKKQIVFNNKFNTDSNLFGKLFKVLNIDFKRKIIESTNMVDANLKVNYKLAMHEPEADLRNVEIKIEHDLHSRTLREILNQGYQSKISIKQNILEQFKSRIFPNLIMKASDCVLNEKLVKNKSDNKFEADYTFNWNCNNKVWSDDHVKIYRIKENNAPKTSFSYVHKSDFYEGFNIEAAVHRFTKTHGLVSGSINAFGKVQFSKLFSYDRSFHQLTNKLATAHYRSSTSFGPKLSKNCDLNIASGNDYYNSLNCQLITTKAPNMELNYGYKLKLANVEEFIFGKRNFEFDVIIPGRTLRATYNGNYPSYLTTNDDDDDSNNEREFNATATYFWDYEKDQSKSITVNFKRDNYAKGKSVTFVEFVDTPHFNILKFKVDKIRTFNTTNLIGCLSYEMKTGSKNCLTLDAKLSSGLYTNSFSLETNLERPSFNTLYENRFNKFNGRLQYLGIRVGKVLKLSVDKEYDPEQRRVSLQFTNPDDSKYQFEGKSNIQNEVYTVEGTLSQDSRKLSNIVSKFDAKNANFDVKINGLVSNNKYRFNFGVFDETLANAYVKDENANKVLGKATIQVAKNQDNVYELIMHMKWNRFWRLIQQDILGNTNNNLANENNKYNSYFGDVYSQVTEDLKPVVLARRKVREAINSDFRNLFFMLVDFYSNFLTPNLKQKLRKMELELIQNALRERANESEELPVYKKVLRKYNKIAKKLTALNLKIRKYSKTLSKYIPRLPTYEYNREGNGEYENDLVIRRPTYYSKNLYQFNHEYRNYVRKAGQNFLKLKRNLVRSNLSGMGIKALYNKYKYRSLSDYTMVAHVFNKRNIIGFDGESVILQSRCKYLLAHETQKNRFSVVLNFDRSDYPISVYAYGQKSVDIGYSSAAVQNVATPLPRYFDLGDHGSLSVKRVNDAICVELNHDLKVCCYDDSKSCTIAVTRWFTGKLNGLLGKADNSPSEIVKEDWFLNSKCKARNAALRLPTETAVKTCYSIFGRHRKSTFRNAIQTVKPEGWQTICESVLTANLKYKCAIMRAFVHHAKQEKVEINAVDECFSCTLKNNAYSIGQSVAKNVAGLSSNFESGSDVVFIVLPCPYTPVDYSSISKKFDSNSNNRRYAVLVSEDDASIAQSASGQIHNLDQSEFKYLNKFSSPAQVSKSAFEKALVLAGSIFTQRLAQNRVIVFTSCGNCLPYKLNSFKYVKHLAKRNVIVHSIGLYNIKNLDDDEFSEEIPFAYNKNKLFLYNKEDNSFDNDYLDSYRINHRMDLCGKLAVKTDGFVVDANKDTLKKSAELVLNNKLNNFSYKLGKCQKIDSSYGDLTDFSYTRTQIASNEDY